MATRKAHRSPRIASGTIPGSKKSAKIADALVRVQGLEKEMAQIIREMQEKVSQLECLSNFSSLMNSSLNTEMVREKALEATCQLLGCETASLLLIDKAKGELYWESALGNVGQKLKKNFRLAIDDQSIAGRVAMSGESLVVNDVEKELHHNKVAEQMGFRVLTTVCVPLKSKDRIIGVLQALNKVPSLPTRASRHVWSDFYENDKKLLETLSHQVAIAIENSQLYTEIQKNFFETVEALSEAIEKKDHYTGGHTKRVVHYSVCVAKYLNLTPGELERVRLGAILHDIGKIGIEDKILKKPAALGSDEWKVMQTHPELGYEIMSRVAGLKDIIGGVRYHHERWDGKGYPLGLKGEEIPLIARIIAVADTYDAMVSTRPYRKGMAPQVAHEEIVKCSGTQFDPTVVAAFVEAFKKEKMGRGSGGSSHSSEKEGLLSNCD